MEESEEGWPGGGRVGWGGLRAGGPLGECAVKSGLTGVFISGSSRDLFYIHLSYATFCSLQRGKKQDTGTSIMEARASG